MVDPILAGRVASPTARPRRVEPVFVARECGDGHDPRRYPGRYSGVGSMRRWPGVVRLAGSGDKSRYGSHVFEGDLMHINRLRLLGFKSFVEPTELVIEKGLTGVVGPNGCGKSNLLEALRWVMGETSHKSMRAAAMDDVIFSGTATRPAAQHAPK